MVYNTLKIYFLIFSKKNIQSLILKYFFPIATETYSVAISTASDRII